MQRCFNCHNVIHAVLHLTCLKAGVWVAQSLTNCCCMWLLCDSQLQLHFTNIHHLLSEGNNASPINFSHASTKVTQLFFSQGDSPQVPVIFSWSPLAA